jgi:hypothetical protein
VATAILCIGAGGYGMTVNLGFHRHLIAIEQTDGRVRYYV